MWRAAWMLLVAVSVGAEDEAIDLSPGWNRGEVCDRTMTRTIRVRGNQMVGRVERAITAEMTEELDVRDKVLSTTPGGAAERMERHYRRARQTTTTAVAGFDSDSKRQIDPNEGRTKKVDVGEEDAFLVEMLDQAIYRKGVKVGDTWGGEDSGDEAEGRLSFKLVEVQTANEARTARVHVTLKARISTGQGAIDVEAKGYVYFSLEAGRIVRSSLSGPVKLELGELGALHGTISEESTLAMVEANESPGTDSAPTDGGLVRPGRNQ